MSTHPFNSFITLIEFDRGLHDLEHAVKNLKQEVSNLKMQEQTLDQELAHAQDTVYRLKKDVDMQELELKDLDQQEKVKKKKLDAIANYKEYQSLQNEIASLKQKQHDDELALMELWNKLETGQKMLDQAKQKHADKIIGIRAQVVEKEEKISNLTHDYDAKIVQREEKEKVVPEEWLEKYRAMRSRVTNPVVEVLDTSCGACFYALSMQELMRLKRGALLECKGCYRFLYIPEAIHKKE